jgi:predicted nucleic acid-binding protein
LLIEGDFTAAARNTLTRDDHWIAPASWRAEFVNVLATNVRQGMFTLDQAIEKLKAADLLVQTTETVLDDREVIALSVAFRIATYDCVYIWLARHYSIKVVTRDTEMLKKFKDVAVNLEEFGSDN